MKRIILFLTIAAVIASCRHDGQIVFSHPEDSVAIPAPDYVAIEEGRFAINGDVWFPIMLNYKAEIHLVDGTPKILPANYYTQGTMREHFDTIASWGFNAIRLCLDSDSIGEELNIKDTAAMLLETRRAIQMADSAGLRVLLLIRKPFSPIQEAYTKCLLRTLADLPALWAYDFMNEPLYFDPAPTREKQEAVNIASEWRHWVRQYAPHQLFTISSAEPIEVFEWDPSILPIDFIEIHTYHPMRWLSEMTWYSRYCHKPWMVGETGLPSDNDSVPYEWQRRFLYETYQYANLLGAIGYGWWEFQDCPGYNNFEGRHTGLRDADGKAKPATRVLKDSWFCFSINLEGFTPPNYYNMLGYNNICLTGTIIDEETKKPVEGAVIRGWNSDWSVGMNTFSDSCGNFTLYSNDYNIHFEISAPGMSHLKFDKRHLRYKNVGNIDKDNLPDRKREYQQIDYRHYLESDSAGNPLYMSPTNPDLFNRYSLTADLGTIKLKKIPEPSILKK